MNNELQQKMKTIADLVGLERKSSYQTGPWKYKGRTYTLKIEEIKESREQHPQDYRGCGLF